VKGFALLNDARCGNPNWHLRQFVRALAMTMLRMSKPMSEVVLRKEEEEEGFYKFLPANTADRLCQLWQSCSNHHEI